MGEVVRAIYTSLEYEDLRRENEALRQENERLRQQLETGRTWWRRLWGEKPR